MGTVKQNCSYIPRQPNIFRLKGVHPDWEMHPSYVSAIESLDSYNLWVCEVVLPIAFQWIEEHKDEVYSTIPDEEKDDVGVVIASAFELIQQMSAYKQGLITSQAYEDNLANNNFDPSKTNPVWSEISRELRSSFSSIYAKRTPQLKSTIK